MQGQDLCGELVDRITRNKALFNVALTILVVISSFIILYSRRGEALTKPQVWNEDGYLIFPQVFSVGWINLTEPIQGYLITISRPISNTALTFYPGDYPFFHFVGLYFHCDRFNLYLSSPDIAEGSFFVALSFFIPSAPEKFGITFYSFWWFGLLLIFTIWRQAVTFTVAISYDSVVWILFSSNCYCSPLDDVAHFLFRSRSDFLYF